MLFPHLFALHCPAFFDSSLFTTILGEVNLLSFLVVYFSVAVVLLNNRNMYDLSIVSSHWNTDDFQVVSTQSQLFT